MTKKYFIVAFIFVTLTLALSGGAWLYNHLKGDLSTSGEPAFATTKNKMFHIGKVRISSHDGSEITLYRQNGLWYFKEAKDYFANLEQLNNLFNMINDSEIIFVEEASERALKKYGLNEETGILMQTYNVDDTLLDELLIGKKNKDKTCYARLPQTKKYIYRISSCAAFSTNVADWMPYPLLSLQYYLFNNIRTEENEFNREAIDRKIVNSVGMRRLILALGGLDYQGIIRKEELLNDENLNIKTRRLEVEFVDGLVYVLTIRHIDDTYWLEIAMKQGKVVRKSVKPFIENNQQYYDKWLFQLDPYQGKILFEFEG